MSSSANQYHFITKWRVKATPEEVCDILEDAEALATWWPSVYLDVKILDKGGQKGVGKIVELYTKGWLPYTLRWRFKITVSAYPSGYSLDAFGDFEGRGIWSFEKDGDFVDIIYDWKINADKPLLKNFSFIMKPLFSANHHWAMRKGEESLNLELLRRQPGTQGKVPPPPGPTFPHNITNNKIL